MYPVRSAVVPAGNPIDTWGNKERNGFLIRHFTTRRPGKPMPRFGLARGVELFILVQSLPRQGQKIR